MSETFDVAVVDNATEPDSRVRDIVDHFGVHYIHQPVPGIAAARNTALEHALTRQYSYLAFLDDDERVRAGWLTQLVDTATRFGADVVNGPVVPALGAKPPWWATRMRLFERPRAATGSRTRWPATNNVLIRLDTVGAERFPEAFSHTGGSDSAFFARLAEQGSRFVWCDEAVVDEDVPVDRQTAKWVWMRAVRLGNVSARLMRERGASSVRVALLGVGRIAGAPLLVVFDVLRSGKVRSETWLHAPKGVGMVGAVVGRLHIEYARQ